MCLGTAVWGASRSTRGLGARVLAVAALLIAKVKGGVAVKGSSLADKAEGQKNGGELKLHLSGLELNN